MYMAKQLHSFWKTSNKSLKKLGVPSSGTSFFPSFLYIFIALLTQELYESLSSDGYASKLCISRKRMKVAANLCRGEEGVAC